jgi:hypothetical protein
MSAKADRAWTTKASAFSYRKLSPADSTTGPGRQRLGMQASGYLPNHQAGVGFYMLTSQVLPSARDFLST